jgi:hypothetical protein
MSNPDMRCGIPRGWLSLDPEIPVVDTQCALSRKFRGGSIFDVIGRIIAADQCSAGSACRTWKMVLLIAVAIGALGLRLFLALNWIRRSNPQKAGNR